jgi:ferritin-like metal-binding protein YciE
MRLFVLAFVTLCSLGTATRALAADGQSAAAHTASQSALDAALQQHTTATTEQRQAVLRVLDHAEVKDVAGRMGVDLRQAKNAVATMDAQQLAQVSAQARAVDQALAGGASNVVISTTMIIIILLVIILLVVAIK